MSYTPKRYNVTRNSAGFKKLKAYVEALGGDTYIRSAVIGRSDDHKHAVIYHNPSAGAGNLSLKRYNLSNGGFADMKIAIELLGVDSFVDIQTYRDSALHSWALVITSPSIGAGNLTLLRSDARDNGKAMVTLLGTISNSVSARIFKYISQSENPGALILHK